VARFLWKVSTGRDYEWIPTLSTAYNEAAKRMSEVSLNCIDNGTLKNGLDENPREILAKLELAKNDLRIMREERTRHIVKFNWITGIAVLLLLLSLAWRLI